MKTNNNNRALKFKWHSLYGQVLQDRKLKQAWLKVKSNRGSGGVDGVTIDKYSANETENLDNLLHKLRAKEYIPSPVRRVYIPKKNGKRRPLGIPNIEDRIVQQTLVDILQPKFEDGIFHKWSCGYRPGIGVERALQIIMWNTERGYKHVYDCDIKGFFDNIPHKKLMGVLNQYIADGTVLDMIWKWLKAGYMEEGKYHDTNTGTPQGGVISPLLANIYLNELDQDLAQHGIHFVRYADDFLLFAKTKEDIKYAAKIAKNTLERLGLEVQMEKTSFIDFDDDDYDFLGFTFHHWRKRKRDGTLYYSITPSPRSIKDFKYKIKDKTRKSFTLNKETWVNRLNPIIRGKTNYYLNVYKAIKSNEEYGQQSRCSLYMFENQLKQMDGYIRRRLRVCMIHRNPTMRKGMAMKIRWSNEFFLKIKLIPSYFMFCKYTRGMTVVEYLGNFKRKNQKYIKSVVTKYKKQGREYYTSERRQKISNAYKFAGY